MLKIIESGSVCKIIVTAVKERKYSMNSMKKVGLSVLVMFGIVGATEGLSGSPSNKKQDIDIDKQDVRGRTQLHDAISKRFSCNSSGDRTTEDVKTLINRGANLDIQDEHGESPLHLAIRFNDIEVVSILINSGANVNIQDKSGRTPLYDNVSRLTNNIEIAKLLIAAKADLNIQDKSGRTPLHTAVSRCHGIYSSTMIELVKLLIAAKADLNIKDWLGETPLHKAVDVHSIEAVKLLIAAKADLNIQNKDGETPLLYLFIRNFDDFDEIIKLMKTKIEISKLLIAAKADLNIQDLEGRSALHWAAKRGILEAVKLLVAAKADKNIQDSFGKTALDYAETAPCIPQEIKEILRKK